MAPGNFAAVYYRDPSGSMPVREFLWAPEQRAARAALFNQIDRLNDLDDSYPHLPFPASSQVEGELRELRCHFGRTNYRIFYRRSRRLLVLLHIIIKNSDKLPPAEIAVAQQRWDDFKARMDQSPRTPPRAVGRNAP